MQQKNRIKWAVALGAAIAASTYSGSFAETERCRLYDGTKVVCPVRTEAELEAAAAAYDDEAELMSSGVSGSTYGVAPFDYLTGVGKRTEGTTPSRGDSGYGGKGGKTELWDRVEKPAEGESVYNQWTNNWSPAFKTTLVPGADPNEGKQWYYVYCIACHGWGLQGDGPSASEIEPRPRILTDGDYMNKKSNLQLFTVIKGGGEEVYLSSSMPAWGNLLQDQDIWNVVAWIRMMADTKPPKTVEEYLNPKTTFKPIAGDIDALTANQSDDFNDAQEETELSLAGRGEGALKGGGYVRGGLRKQPEEVDAKVKKGF
ncbi:MAG: cytochrome c [Hyphomicrobiales bacterium]|nr:cytochrome c [Hyphomicrobiales bacterium]